MSRRIGFEVFSSLARTLKNISYQDGASSGSLRSFSTAVTHTSKWLQSKEKPSPMELINSVPPISVEARVIACSGGFNPATGHPVEYINLDGPEPAVCKYCGLRYQQHHGH